MQHIDVLRYLAARPDWSASYRRNVILSLRAFYRWAVCDKHLVKTDPTTGLAPGQTPHRQQPIATEAAVARGLTDQRRDIRAMVALAATMGLRRTEVANVCWTDIVDGTLRILGKGRRLRILPLSDSVRSALDDLDRFPGFDEIFIGGRRRPLTPSAVGALIAVTTGYSPHAHRRRAATVAYRRTGNLRALQHWLGHSSVAITERYLGIDAEDLRRVSNATGVDSAIPHAEQGDLQSALEHAVRIAERSGMRLRVEVESPRGERAA